MVDKHRSTQFDSELDSITKRVLQMGGLVEGALVKAAKALATFDSDLADSVINEENQIDRLEVEIDSDCIQFIAMRQPIASDLRYIIAITKIVANLERAGDEAERVARRTKHIMEDPIAREINISELKVAGELAASELRRALDAFARQDSLSAQKVILEDRALDQEFKSFVRKLTTYMSEDPRAIRVCLDFLTVAKAIERIGDHAKNLAELVVFQASGKDIRHSDSLSN
jgi:phosphate transport system protein